MKYLKTLKAWNPESYVTDQSATLPIYHDLTTTTTTTTKRLISQINEFTFAKICEEEDFNGLGKFGFN